MNSFKVSVLKADGGGFNYYYNNQWFGWSISRNDAYNKAMFIAKQHQA